MLEKLSRTSSPEWDGNKPLGWLVHFSHRLKVGLLLDISFLLSRVHVVFELHIG